MNKKRDKDAIIARICEVAGDDPITNKDAVQAVLTIGLIDNSPRDATYVGGICTKLRKDGTIANKKIIKAEHTNAMREAIIEYCTQHRVVGVRQLAYAMHAQQFIEKKESAFNEVGELVKEMRLNCDIPWECIQDNSRTYNAIDSPFPPEIPEDMLTEYVSEISSLPRDIERSIRTGFPKMIFQDESLRRGLWHNQPYYVEVWIEKKGLLGVFEPVTTKWGVALNACAGQPSLTIRKLAANHFDSMHNEGRVPVVLYFGDYDPAGGSIANTMKNIGELCEVASPLYQYCAVKQVHIEEFGLFTRPIDDRKKGTSGTKTFTDTRAVDLDALQPEMLHPIIESSINQFFNHEIKNVNDKEYAEECVLVRREYENIRKKHANIFAKLESLAGYAEEQLEEAFNYLGDA